MLDLQATSKKPQRRPPSTFRSTLHILAFSFNKLDKAKDLRFASVRVSRDIRVIVHRTQSSLLLCYVGHHDAAYSWAERRKLETHPTTGAAQFVEVRETIEEIKVPKYVEVEQPRRPKPLLFQKVSQGDAAWIRRSTRMAS